MSVEMTLKELFEKQPSELVEEEITAIVNQLRAARDRYAIARQEARVTGKRIKNGSGISRKSIGMSDSSVDDLLAEMFPDA